MVEIAPCSQAPAWVVAFNALLNVLQAVLLALIAERSMRKNREEKIAAEQQSK